MGGGAQATQSFDRIKTLTFASSVVVEKTSKGTHLLRGLRVFKKGTFKDSLGIERTWEDYHLDLMVANYKLLRDSNVLPNVPVRVDHSFSVQNVGGYFHDLYREPGDDTFLDGDVEITEPDVFDKWERGTFRSRSLEVGMYETNDGATYWPVVLGLAFVDLPAVEGLHSRQTGSYYFSQALQDDDKEKPTMFTFNGQSFADQAACEAAIRYAAWVQAAEYAQSLEDQAAAINYATALEQHNANAKALGIEGLTIVNAQPSGQHGAPHTHTFRVNGEMTTDPTVAQRHIDTMEQFRAETTKSNRERFIDELAKANKIGANQLDQFKSHVVTLNDEQYAQFKTMYEAAPAHSLLAPHGNTGGDNNLPPGDKLREDFEVARDTVEQLKRSGMTDDQVQKTSAFKKFTSLEAQMSGQTA